MDTVLGLQRSMAPLEFSETLDRVIFVLTRDLSVTEHACHSGDWGQVKRYAQGLCELSAEVGLMRLAMVARDLSRVADRADAAATGAVTARLVRLGEESLFALVSIADQGPDIHA